MDQISHASRRIATATLPTPLLYAAALFHPRLSLRGVREALPATIGRRDWHSVRILDLPPGRYALAVYVDRNGNGKLDRGMFGIPSEPYGFSNGGGAFGPPEFGEAQVELGEADMTIRIDLN